ncbi:MAG: ATP-binding cassette domain-containing protein [Geminicoccaceae bacterium]
MAEMVRLDRLAKRFGPVHAVEGVSFAVGRGEVLGFLGPNGAGKSTTMRMLTGFLAPSDGTAIVMGFDVQQQPIEVKRRVGYLPEGAPLYGDMTVLSFLRFIAEMRGLRGADAGRAIEAAIARTELAEVAHRPIETLSKGFKRRVGIAQAIMHDPPVLVLDEPTDGLDPNQKHHVRRLIQEMAPDKAIIISTHILEEVEAICSRAVIIARGKVIADERPDALKRRSRYHNAVRLTVDADLAPGLAGEIEALAEVAAVERAAAINGLATLTVLPEAGRELAHRIGGLVKERGVALDELTVEQGRLDDVFRDLTAAH